MALKTEILAQRRAIRDALAVVLDPALPDRGDPCDVLRWFEKGGPFEVNEELPF